MKEEKLEANRASIVDQPESAVLTRDLFITYIFFRRSKPVGVLEEYSYFEIIWEYRR